MTVKQTNEAVTKPEKDPRRTEFMKNTRRIENMMEVVRIIAGMGIAYLVALLILVSFSSDPLFIVKQFILGPFSSPRRIGSIINLAVPFMLCGLSMCFMYAVNKFNLIGESIFMLSGCIVTWIGLAIGNSLPMAVMVPLLLVIGALIGAALAFIPAIMDWKLSANVVVVSLMLNAVIAQLAVYILRFYMKDPGISFIGSYETPSSMQLPQILGKMRIGSGVIIAVIAVIFVSILFYKTSFGWKMRIVGSNPKFATAVGLSTLGISFAAQLAGGAFAGIAGATEIMNSYKRFQWTASTGHGFDGLLVAVLAKRNPVLVPVGALSGFKNRLIYRSVQAEQAGKKA